jgi:hypothetical protein
VVNDFLVRYLDSISEDLLAYLDGDEELPVDVARRILLQEVAVEGVYPQRCSERDDD